MDERNERTSQPSWDPAILAAERDREGPSAAQQASLLARLDRSVALSAPSVPANASIALRRKVLTTALAYLLGVATGALAHDRLSRRATDEPRALQPIAAHESAPPQRSDAGPAIGLVDRDAAALVPDAARPSADAASPRSSSARGATRDSNDLIAETNVIEMARSALARGRAAAALDALERHRTQFARGQLAEDRESLAIEALVTLGRSDEARHRAAAFVRRWPDGMYRARVDAALALIR